ncbi:MAG: molybdopterin oxidoreductase family protein [Acidimicrobiales bacterium]
MPEARDRVVDVWGARTPVSPGEEWPERVDVHLQDGVPESDVERWVTSACPLCSHGCGLDIAVRGGRIAGVRGRGSDRVNRGRLGPKGLFGWQANNSPDRLRRPLVRQGGDLVESDWDTAMDLIVARSKELLQERGPLSMAFYTSGQLFLEDYYAQAMVAMAGVGTPHVDGNTRLCTATADQALKESFGADGDPGCYEDLIECDTLLLVGHNMPETQTVMWARILDRLDGPTPPRLVVIDPRRTEAARRADVHLPVKNGTNLALLNGLQRELLVNGWVDEAFVSARTVGLEAVEQVVMTYTPELVAEICEVPAEDVQRAAQLLGTSQRLVSTVLQGVYQSHQATASAVAVNNIQLLRGMIGRPGATVFQMNGQPTAQNTRETGADGDFPAFLNWQNPDHVQRLARHWNVEPQQIPAWSRHTHAMQIFRYCEEGAVRFLWITGTNPAVSLPDLDRIRSILSQERLFVVASDAFANETTALADVVLPAALWGEKTGTFTNADRTVHLSDQAVAPPGDARSDHDVFVDYARRMGFTGRDGSALIPWSDVEGAFDHFKELTAGRPCDYSGLSYAKLRAAGGIQWPCNDTAPDGTPRLYTDHAFPSDAAYCEEFGHDLTTAAAKEPDAYRAEQPGGRAFLKSAHWTPPHEETDEAYPLIVTTGRTVHHWHTRTKTARAPELQAAAPEAWVEISELDAKAAGVDDGDRVRIETRRGAIEVEARITDVRKGTVFVPFHYGSWDRAPGSPPRAANELTLATWDPISHQPCFKHAAARITRVGMSS